MLYLRFICMYLGLLLFIGFLFLQVVIPKYVDRKAAERAQLQYGSLNIPEHLLTPIGQRLATIRNVMFIGGSSLMLIYASLRQLGVW